MLSVPSAQHDFCQDNNRKKSRYQISEEALLNGRKITRQPDTDIHAGKENADRMIMTIPLYNFPVSYDFTIPFSFPVFLS